MLYLIATPIGNLEDITYRAVEVLKKCDLILCEDTRHSRTLMKRYEIETPLKSYHKFSEAKSEENIIEKLLGGEQVALISDAGTPGVSDPGTRLVKKCIENDIQVSTIPGACAAIAALTCSGLDTDLFQFVGFLAKKAKALKEELAVILRYPGTSICYESPHRLKKILTLLNELAPERELVVARELTKAFEEVKRGCAIELLEHWKDRAVKGEIVLMIAGEKETQIDWEGLSIEEHVVLIQKNYQLTKNESIKMVAQLRGVPRGDIYDLVKNN